MRWRPFDLRANHDRDGRHLVSFRAHRAPLRGLDIEQRAAQYGIPFTKAPAYPVDAKLLADRVGIVAAEQGWCPAYTEASYRAWFLDDRPLGLVASVDEVLRGLK